jgi:hypothetical protein
MKIVYTLLIIAMLANLPPVLSAQVSSSKIAMDEARQIQRVRRDFFNAIAASDYQGMRGQCTPDFQLLENGHIMTVEDLINLVKSGEGKSKIVYSFEDIRIKIESLNAWMSYRNKAVVKTGDKTTEIEWLESAVFEKKNGRWKMVLLHSTVVKPKK